jgi:hypothetical protein
VIILLNSGMNILLMNRVVYNVYNILVTKIKTVNEII